MRRIYLVRHGLPDFPTDEKYCIGSTDTPLGPLGRLQACLLGRELRGVRVFSSPLSRALETARAIDPSPELMDGLREMHAGDWDGLSFTAIKRGWPELFARRGVEAGLSIPNSEDFSDGQRRFALSVEAALNRSEGDICVVAHSTVIQSFICLVLGEPPERARQHKLPYGSCTTVGEENGVYSLLELGRLPQPELDGALCEALLSAAAVPEHIARHCRAVAAEAARIVAELARGGVTLDAELIDCAARLHDIARLSGEHAAVGAGWLRALGYGACADLIRQHHGLDDPSRLDGAAVVYIADKCVSESGRVTLDERFAASIRKCADAEARAAHRSRYEEAVGVRELINGACGREVIL